MHGLKVSMPLLQSPYKHFKNVTLLDWRPSHTLWFPEHLLTGCNLMNLFFVVDEYTDVEPASIVREMVDIVIDALKNPQKPRPEGEIILGEIARRFWDRGRKTASPTAERHLLETFTLYLESVVQQAVDRDSSTLQTVDEYFRNRRQNIGVRPSCVPMELDLNLTDEVFYHPVLMELTEHITDIILIDNDIASYNKEQATGDDRYNIITVAMCQFNLDIEGAMEWAVDYHAKVKSKFLDGLKRIPSWGPDVDQEVEEYIYGLANWPRCNDCWNFESGRYFGSKGLEIQKTRVVPLYSKVIPPLTLRRENVSVLLVDELNVAS